MNIFRTTIATLAALALTACAATNQRTEGAPVTDTGKGRIFVAVANPLAAEAGMAVLRRGGSAADAAVAVQAMLSLVEPQSSGMGGGAFATYYDGKSRKITIYDGREAAPM
ncbi:MAG: gamma-glutamyltransferase, partial [Sphingomonadales bacterium]